MNRVLIGVFFLCCGLIMTSGNLMADGDPNDKYEGREHIKIDHEAMKNMTPEERHAAMQAYKAERQAEAQRNGGMPDTEGGYRPLDTPRQVGEPALPKIPGTNITYDNGTVTGTAGNASQMLGNRFDTALNPSGTMCCFPVETTGSVTMITFDMVNTFFNSVVFSLYSNVMGTTAQQVTSMARPGIMTGLNTLTIGGGGTANTYMNGTFLAGIWQFDPTMTAVGVGTGTTGGQGFHAISLNDGAMGSMLATLMSLNAVFRVSGNVATPVELMNFEID